MYHSYFGLSAHPFKLTPDTSFFFEEGQRKAILNGLVFALQNGDGIIKLTGEVGSGKTFLSRILEQVLPDNFEFIFLVNPNMPPEYVLAAIARDLGLDIPQQTDKLEVLHALQEQLLSLHASNKQVVVIIDEAQSMSPETLEEVRLLSNLETESHKLLQILLIGQPELDSKLNRHDIRQIRERITHSLYLPALNRKEIHRYIDYRLRRAGYRGAPIFGQISTALIAFHSRGLLRRINILADKALLVAFSRGARAVAVRDTLKSVSDSSNAQPQNSSRAGTILIPMLIAAVMFTAPVQWSEITNTIRPALLGESSGETPESAQPAAISDQAAMVEVEPVIQPVLQNILENRIALSKLWIDQSTTEGFSIQLLQTYSEKSAPLQQFIDSSLPESLLPETYVFPARVNNKTLWSIFFGQFPTYADAEAALQGLDSRLRDNQPFIVSLNSIKGLFRQKGTTL